MHTENGITLRELNEIITAENVTTIDMYNAWSDEQKQHLMGYYSKDHRFIECSYWRFYEVVNAAMQAYIRCNKASLACESTYTEEDFPELISKVETLALVSCSNNDSENITMVSIESDIKLSEETLDYMINVYNQNNTKFQELCNDLISLNDKHIKKFDTPPLITVETLDNLLDETILYDIIKGCDDDSSKINNIRVINEVTERYLSITSEMQTISKILLESIKNIKITDTRIKELKDTLEKAEKDNHNFMTDVIPMRHSLYEKAFGNI